MRSALPLLAVGLVLTGCGTPREGSLTERLHNHVVRSLAAYYAPEAVERRARWQQEQVAEELRDRGRGELVDLDSCTKDWVVDHDRVERWGDVERTDDGTWRIDGERFTEGWDDPEDIAKAIDEATR